MAERARHVATGMILYAHEIAMIDEVDNHGWQCLGCPGEMWAAAADGAREYKQSPHFRGTHIGQCDIEGEYQAKTAGPIQAVRRANGPPADYPNQLVLPAAQVQIIPQPAPPGAPQPQGHVGRYAGRGQGQGNLHAQYARTLRRIAEFYAAYPECHHYPLTIPGVDGNTYGACFQQIQAVRVRHAPPLFLPKILFAPIMYTAGIVDEETSSLVTLYPAQFVQNPNEIARAAKPEIPGPQYRVRVSFEGNVRRRNVFRTEAQFARDHMAKTRGQRPYACLFFMGTQNPQDRLLFEVADSRLACFVVFPPD